VDPALLASVEKRVNCCGASRLSALIRDLDRATHGDPPIWEAVTMSFAGKVSELPSLPQGSRSRYEQLHHERH